jgi:hypothetical protein
MKFRVKDGAGVEHEIVDNYGVFNINQFSKDADSGIYFARQLELRIAKIYEIMYPELPARSIFPVSRIGGPGVETIVEQYMDIIGNAEIGSGEEVDFPRADVVGGEVSSKVRPIITGFGYSWLEIQRAMRAGISLNAARANAAKRAFETKLNDIAFNGHEASGITGFFSNAEIPRESAAATGAGSATTFVSKSPDNIVADIEAAMNDPWEDSMMIHKPNTLLMPVSQYRLIASTRMNAYDTMTILSFLLNNHPSFMGGAGTITPVNQLKGAGPTAGADCMVAYQKTEEVLELRIPFEQQFFPVQQRGFQYMVPSLGLTGGVVVRYPKAIKIVEGI